MPPVMLLTKSVRTAPVVPSSAARAPRGTLLTRVNRPPAYTVVLVTASSNTLPLVLAVNVSIGAPVVGLIRAIAFLFSPPTVPKSPET